MKTIHQQIAEKRRQIVADEALVAGEKESWQTSTTDMLAVHEAKQRLPRLRTELEDLCESAHKGEAAVAEMRWALSKMVNEMPVGGRELSLAITHAEDALHRLRRHLGDAEASKPAEAGAPSAGDAEMPKLLPHVPQPKPR